MKPQELTSLRISAGMEQRELAQLLGCSAAYVCMMEGGKRAISSDMEVRIAECLSVARDRRDRRRELMRQAVDRAMKKPELVKSRIEHGLEDIS